MDTFSSSISTFNLPTGAAASHHRKSHDHHHFKNHFPPQQPHLTISSTTTKPPTNSKLSNKNLTNPTFVKPSSHISPLKQSPKPQFQYQNPSTGYAVALLDIARCHNSVEVVVNNVKRLSKWLSNCSTTENPYVEKKENGGILINLMKKWNFDKYLVKLVKLLIEKNKVEMVNEVLMEFVRVYDELCGFRRSNNQVVLVPPGVKIEVNQVGEIARRVQKITGAEKVMVRQLV